MLHTVNKSPFEKSSLDTCLRLAAAGSVILLIEDGVYAAARGTAVEPRIRDAMTRHRICALGPDLDTRGLEHGGVIEGIDIIGYDGFVDLAAEHRTVQSWF